MIAKPIARPMINGTNMNPSTQSGQCDDLGTVSAELEKTFGEAKSINLVWKAQNDIDNPALAAAVVRLSDALEDCDDVSTVFHNSDMTEEAMATLEDDE